MRKLTIDIGGALLLLLSMLMTACVSGDSEGDGGVVVSPETDDCYLDIYVYAPDRPIVTRAEVGPIEAISEAESMIHSLQIWVFRHDDASPATAVGYLNPDPLFLNETGYQKYQMLLDREFVKTLEGVDVYVVANAGSVGLTLGEDATREDLDAAVIGTEYFGTTDLYDKDELDQDGNPDATPASGRIATSGLPMSAIAEEQPIWGSFPHLRIGRSENETTILELTRAVSKLRFVLCQIKDQIASKTLVSINEIKLNGGLIPTKTSLLPGTTSYTGKYAIGNPPSDAITFVGTGKEIEKLLHSGNDHPSWVLPSVVNPLAYAYETQSAQEYEDMINQAIAGTYKADENDEALKELGLTYLRESDKQLTGTINYTYITGQDQTGQNITETKEATFAMAAPGDFLRNHSWIVYIYYMDSEIYTLTVTHIGMRSWNDDPNSENPIVYNW